MAKGARKEKVVRRREVDYFQEYPPASRAAQGFTLKYSEKKATGDIFELKFRDTGKPFFKVTMEWDEKEVADGSVPSTKPDGRIPGK